MTLIALSLNNNFPILVGDILITSKDGQGKNVVTPSVLHGTGDFLSKLDMKPWSLKQKIYVINKRLCIGMAGRVDQMYSLLRTLRAFFKDDEPDPKEFENFMNGYENEKLSELSFLSLLVFELPNGMLDYRIFCNGRVEDLDHKSFGKVYAIGSGASQYLNQIGKLEDNSKVDKDGEKIIETEIPLMAIQQNLQIIGRCLASETFTLSTLFEAWGGGFEMIILTDQGFQKLKELTVAIIELYFDETSKRITKQSIMSTMRYEYENDALVIYSFNHKHKRKFVATEIDKEREHYKLTESIEEPDYNSGNVIFYYYVRLPNERAESGQQVILNNQQKGIRFYYEDGKLMATIGLKIKDKLEERIIRKYF